LRKLIIPLYSCRSKHDGTFSLLKDGNFQLHAARMSGQDVIVLPRNCSDISDVIRMGILTIEQMRFLEYSVSPLEIRKNFFDINSKSLLNIATSASITHVISDMSCIPVDIVANVSYNFNVSKVDSIDRPFVDSFFEQDCSVIKQSDSVTVLNQNQLDSFVSVNPDFINKIRVDTHVASKAYYEAVMSLVPKATVGLPKFDVFHPFRLTDNSYEFDKVCDCSDIILVTDPTDTIKAGLIAAPDNVVVYKLDKVQYYHLLSTHPQIRYYVNPDETLHPGLADFIYFDCKITSPWVMPTITDLLVK